MSADVATLGSLPDRIALEHASLRDALPVRVAPPDKREDSLQAFVRLGIPAQREDTWKYANLRPLEQARFAPAQTRLSPDALRALLPARIDNFARYVFVDGRASAELSHGVAGKGCVVHSVSGQPAGSREAAAAPLVGSSQVPTAPPAGSGKAAAAPPVGSAVAPPARPARTSPDHRFAWLNEAFAMDVATIGIAPGLEMPGCIELVFLATGAASEGASYPRIDVHVGEDSELCLIERHISAPASGSFVDSSVHVTLERDAQCRHYRVQQLATNAIWLDTLEASVGEEASYQLHQLALGSQSSRSTLAIDLGAERAELAFDAVALASDGQVQDTYAVVEHAAAHTVTRERFRGIAGARSRAAFNGKIIVARGARGADSQQSLRGLIGGAQAEVDVRPQLEIYTDDVRCTHGATVGKLDDTMLFYLLSRGLDPADAHRLLKRAFIADVIAKIKVEPLRNELEAALEGRVE